MKNLRALLSLSVGLLCANNAHADTFAVLGSADTFAVLASSTVTSTGNTVLSGNLGLYSGSSITGFLPGVVQNGTIHIGDAQALAAQTAALAGYNLLASLVATQDMTGQDLGGKTLTPGVYSFTAAAAVNGNLILDFQGTNNTDIVIQTGSTLNIAGGSTITIINQGTNNNVYYKVGSSATLGANSKFQGAMLANASITFGAGAGSSCGSAIALNGAVTMDSNSISNCSLSHNNVIRFTPVSQTPEPGSFGLLLTGMAGGVGLLRRKLWPVDSVL